MAFDLIGPNRSAYIDHHEELLFDVATLAGVRGPALDRLWEEFCDGPAFTAAEAEALGQEFRALVEVLQRTPDIVRQTWDTQPDAYRAYARVPTARELEAKCAEIVAVCDDGVRSGQGLRSLSD